jgi:DNA-binding transcriptional LysR family regulator
MDLRELRNFVTTAELLSFRKAAECQFISQPALSRQIAGLEKELGVQLFERGGRGVQLTDAGRVLLVQAKQLLEGADRAVAAVRGIPVEQRNAVSVGFSASPAAARLAHLLGELRREVPDVNVQIHSGDWQRHLHQLVDGELDVAVGYLPHSINTSCGALPLWEVEFGLLVPERHPAAHEPSCSIRAFSNDRIMIPRREVGEAYRDRLVHYCVAAGFEPSIDEGHPGSAYSFAAVEVAVATEQGVGFVPRRSPAELPSGTAFVDLAAPPPPSVVGLVWRLSSRSPVVDSLLDVAAGVRNPDRQPLRRAPEVSLATA